uniref:CUB-like domain-containing protein n=1 Tax=Caenorhabditis brenneri TaxID=135651 RepID=B6VBS5_CAEBE|nr:hypothetical protein Cbre_JD22.006 [Caenorhabditis brenneri]
MLRNILVALCLAGTTVALDCQMFPSSQIYDGSEVYIPGPTADLQTIPANFNCVYKIQAPANSTDGMYINLTLKNGMKGLNDYIQVTNVDGYPTMYTNRSYQMDQYVIPPGSVISVKVVTKSVYMASQFSIILNYHANKIGPSIPMKASTQFNFLDLNTLRDGKNFFTSVTFTNFEPIYITFPESNAGRTFCWNCYVIDGTIDNQTAVYTLENIENGEITTQSNAVTVLTSVDGFMGMVLDTWGDAAQNNYISSLAVPNSLTFKTTHPMHTGAIEVVNFNGTGITMNQLSVQGTACKAYVLSGPPNNQSQVILDLSTAQVPHTFDLQALSVVSEECEISFSVV